ncbi:MAG TPA: adenylate/guanylate cyclase domain-containing protein [Anaerolineae bacterium]|nr:adenylate/guanylate cyclase domain-containing protein [Anaerolineae bacterium]
MLDEASLRDQLSLQNRRIDLILAIDHIRDAAEDERDLVTSAVSAVCDAIGADLCLMSLIDRETNALELRALTDRTGALDQAGEEALRRMAQRALDLPGVQLLEADETLSALGLAHWLGTPLRVDHAPLGALLLMNRKRPFATGDHELLASAESQLDSAVVHARAVYDLRRQRQELETLYKVDRIRDQGLPFDEMLNGVLAELCRAISSEAGFILLLDNIGNQLELKAVTDRDLLTVVDHYQIVYTAALEAVQSAQAVARRLEGGRIQSLICIPLMLNDRIIGVFGVINRRGRTDFNSSDRRLLAAIASQMDTAIFEGLQTKKYREVFGRSVGAHVMERLLNASDRDLLKGERVVVTSLFSDIRGFTSIAERIEPEALVQMLNEHLSAMTEIVLTYEGTVDKFVGDCVMALYNAPERQPDHALRAVKTALDMMKAHRRLMQRWEALGWEAAPIGIGLDTGETIVGNFGSAQRNEYTAISHHVNLASRLCGVAEGDQILISSDTYDLIRDEIAAQPVRELHLKGVAEVMEAYQVLGLK